MAGSRPKGHARHRQIVRQWKLLLALDANRHGLTFDDLQRRLSLPSSSNRQAAQ